MAHNLDQSIRSFSSTTSYGQWYFSKIFSCAPATYVSRLMTSRQFIHSRPQKSLRCFQSFCSPSAAASPVSQRLVASIDSILSFISLSRCCSRRAFLDVLASSSPFLLRSSRISSIPQFTPSQI